MPDGYLWLTEVQQQQLKDILRLPIPRTGQLVANDDYMAPELYVALTPAEGIAGRVDTSVYSGNCLVYEVVDGQLTARGLELAVYNASTDAVPGGSIVAVNRDKWGRWLVQGSTDSRVYLVRLMASGVGIDGGTAWQAMKRREVAGVLSDWEELGTNPDDPFVLYFDDSETHVADEKHYAVPDPLRPGAWLATGVAQAAQASDCKSCAWLTDVSRGMCIYMRDFGGYGRCNCYPTDADPGITGVYNNAYGGYVGTEMLRTCCGCGLGIFKPNSSDPRDSILTLKGVHVSCSVTGSGSVGTVFDKDMKLDCCGTDDDGSPFAIFYGFGRDACADVDATTCSNIFFVKVKCNAICPETICECSCSGPSPFAWIIDLPTLSFAEERLNGGWALTYLGDCEYGTSCLGFSSTITYDSSALKWRLRHGDFVYEIAVASWNPGGSNTFTYVSGSGTHPASITVTGVYKVDPATGTPDALACWPGNTFPVTVDGACWGGPRTDAVTWNGSNAWVFGAGTSYTVTVQCINGRFTAAVATVCPAPDGVTPVTISATTYPTSQTYSPLCVRWDGTAVIGIGIPAKCCVDGTTTTVVIGDCVTSPPPPGPPPPPLPPPLPPSPPSCCDYGSGSHPNFKLTIQDGANAGNYTAVWSSLSLRWNGTVGMLADFQIKCIGGVWHMRVPGVSSFAYIAASSQACGPLAVVWTDAALKTFFGTTLSLLVSLA